MMIVDSNHLAGTGQEWHPQDVRRIAYVQYPPSGPDVEHRPSPKNAPQADCNFRGVANDAGPVRGLRESMRRVAVDDFFRYLPLTSRRDDFDRIARSRQRAPEPGNAHVLRHSLVLYDYHNGHARRPVVARSCFALIHGAPKTDEHLARADAEEGTLFGRR